MNSSFDTKSYFEDIGAWPKNTRSHFYRGYLVGFILSLALTGTAYWFVLQHTFPFLFVVGWVVLLALLQFVVQVMCFLHLGRESVSRERLILLICAAIVVLILVSGSIWIMVTLNSRMMPSSEQMTQYMDSQQGI